FSKVMTWVAFDRGIKGIEQFGLDGPLDRWRELRDHIRESVCRRGYNAKKGCFVQSYESDEVDASLLLLPTVGFISIDDERMVGTVAAIEQELMADGLVLRYDTSRSEDGLPPGEGAFLACSFWLGDVYVMMGRVDEARALFERLLSLRNDVGLLAEEYDALHGRQVGNFPQAFSHVTLVNTAYNLSRLPTPSEQRAAAGPIDPRPSEPGVRDCAAALPRGGTISAAIRAGTMPSFTAGRGASSAPPPRRRPRASLRSLRPKARTRPDARAAPSPPESRGGLPF